MSARQRSSDRQEQALIEWASWIKTRLDAQGWGGGVDNDLKQSLLFGKIASGQHADPVLGELLATEIDGQEQCQRVHRHLMRYRKERNNLWFAVPFARFVGCPVATSTKDVWPEPDVIEIAEGHLVPFILPKLEVPRTWGWSGLQQWEQVAAQTQMSVRNAQVILSALKVDLGMDLRLDVMTRRGKVVADSNASISEQINQAIARTERIKAEHKEEIAQKQKQPLAFCA